MANISDEFAVPSTPGALLHHPFEQRAIEAADRIAVSCDGTCLTYAELNARADSLAEYLSDRGVGPDELVGICMERSVEMVVSLLGILKAGGAYVPLDPSYPHDRLTYMIDDACPRIVLTQQHLRYLLSCIDREVIALDREWERVARAAGSKRQPMHGHVSDRNLAYVIYTSGSTGQPKGAMNEHRGVVNRLRWMQSAYGLGADERVLQKTPFGFDVSVWEFFWPLSEGARLVLARPEGHKDPEYVRRLIDDERITRLHFVPSMLQIFLDWIRPGDCRSLRHVVCSGEELPASLQQRCHALLPHVRLSNLYGPTEAAVDVTAWECHPDQKHLRVPIGRPISGARIYILDEHNCAVPEGVPGEIFIGGVVVGRGYLNRVTLTAERFVADSFSADPRARMYRTGDLGQWRADGAIEYLGRNDFQVKVRGFRIELGEIEARLRQHPDIKEAVVVTREDRSGDKRLVAYIKASNVRQQLILSLREYLKSTLPDYMMPSAFVVLEAFPLTTNGKLDRCALPAPEPSSYVGENYEPPQGDVEQTVAQSWQSVLALERVGRQDNFFELGGNSLLILRMMKELQERGLSVEIDDAFRHSTLAELAQGVTAPRATTLASPSTAIPIGCRFISPAMLTLVELQSDDISAVVERVPGGAANIQDIYPLTPLQEGILFHHLRSGGEADPYVRVMMLRLQSRQDVDDLISAFQAAIDRHDALRTAIVSKEVPVPVQVVYRQATLPVEWLTLRASASPGSLQALQENGRAAYVRLGLAEAPLMRLAIVVDEERNQWYAALTTHHITTDNESLQILFAEVARRLDGDARPLPSPGSYRDHVCQVLMSLRAEDPEAFFREKLEDMRESSAPFGLRDVHGDGTSTTSVRVGVDADLTARARAQARRLRTSMATLFHAAWGLVVAHTTGKEDLAFGSVLLGRFGSGASQHTVGMFLNTLPIRLQLDVTAKDLVRQVHQELADLLRYEHSPLITAQRSSGVDPSEPLFTSILNYRHQPTDFSRKIGDRIEVIELIDQERTNYPIVISVDEFPQELVLAAQTDRRIEAGRVAGYLRTAIASLVNALDSSPEHPARRLAILSAVDVAEILSFNSANEELPHPMPIHEVFERRVRETPSAVAVTTERRTLTYEELNAIANQLARHLIARGCKSGDIVPIVMQRSPALLVAQLAVLKSGAAYLPVDPGFSEERRSVIIKDCNARLVLASQELSAPSELTAVDWLEYPEGLDNVEELSEANLDIPVLPSSPAYVVYTFGPTGTPMGVVVPHHAASRFVANGRYVAIEATDCVAHYSDPASEASTFEVWGPLLNGARVLLVPDEAASTHERLFQCLQDNRVSIVWMDVRFLRQHCKRLAPALGHLRCLITGGDVVEPSLAHRVLENKPAHWINVYGCTQCAGFATAYEIEEREQWLHGVPVGYPISHTNIYVLDEDLTVVPIGVAGEIYVAGAGLALGYLNSPELTAERFLADPFSMERGARMHHTGDLGRWRADGVLEFLGRRDDRIPAQRPSSHVVREYEAPQGEIERAIAEIWQAVLKVERVGRQDDFFQLGGHSLRAVASLARVNQMFETSLKVNDLYRARTIVDLAHSIQGTTLGDSYVDLAREAVLEPEVSGARLVRGSTNSKVLLTGAAGFVGRFLLAQLLNDTDAVVYCLIRAPSSREGLSRIQSTLAKWDLWRDGFEERIVAIPGDLNVPGLGIDAPSHRELCETVDCIYHVATRMNHLETYAMCKRANVDGTRELLKLASQRRLKTVNYISTLSVFSACEDASPRTVCEETPIEHERHSVFDGYAASKWVAERLVLIAGDRGVPCNVFRLGLVWADSQAGRYDELQREYRVFKTCLLSGMGIEGYRYEMPPTPVDYVARALVSLALRRSDGGGIFHISSAKQHVDEVFRRCNEIAGTSLEIVSYERWIGEIKRLHQSGRSLPAVPLIHGMFSMDVEAIRLHQRASALALDNLKIDSTRTQRELESLGIVAPVLTDQLLRTYLQGMFEYDDDLRSHPIVAAHRQEYCSETMDKGSRN